MSQVETPALPSGPATGPGAAKTPKARLTADGRDERGQAFRSLLQALDKGAGRPAAAKPAGAGQAEAAGEKTEPGSADPLLELLAASPAEATPKGDAAADAARLLLGPLQSEQAEARPQPRREQGPRREAASALTGALTGAVAGKEAKPPPAAGEAGVAMPTDDTALPELPEPAQPLARMVGAADPSGKEALPADKPFAIAVLRQETHLPPVLRLSPLQQVAEPIRQAVAELAARSGASGEAALKQPAGIAEPTKILHIQLSPVELGHIVVKLRLSQGGMEVRLEASRPETAQALANDQQALREIVKASGHALDRVSVETIHVETAGADPRSGQDGFRSGGRDDGAGRDGRGQEAAFQQDRQNDRREPQRRDERAPMPTLTEDPHDRRESSLPGRDARRYL